MTTADRPVARLRNAERIDGVLRTIGSETVRVFSEDENGNVTSARGSTVPTDATAGYAIGCTFIDAEGGVGATTYINEGTALSCDFNAGGIGGGDVTSVTAGDGLSGGGSSGALTLTVNVDDATVELSGDAIRVKDAGITPAKTNIVEARTATADGTTTGTISANKRHITVTSDDANKIIILPAPVAGQSLVIDVGATGFELRSSTPASIAINGGTGANAESAIPANSTCFLTCVSSTAWKGFYMDADGDIAKIEAAA